MRCLQPVQHAHHRTEPSPASLCPRRGGRVHAIVEKRRQGLAQPWLHVVAPLGKRHEEVACVFHAQRLQSPEGLGPCVRLMVVEVACLQPGHVVFCQVVKGVMVALAVPRVRVDDAHDWVAVQVPDVLKTPRTGCGIEDLEEFVHPRLHRGFVQGQTHGHVVALGVGGQRLQQGAEASAVRQDDERLGSLGFFQAVDHVPHVLGLPHHGLASHRLHGRGIVCHPILGKRRCATKLSNETPSFVVDVIDVTGVAVPKHGQLARLVPALQDGPFCCAHGGQPCDQHVVKGVGVAVLCGMPCDLRPGGQAIPIQRLVQGGVTAGQRTPLFVELLLVFRPRCFSKTPIFDALDVCQIFEDFLRVLEFLVHRGKVAQHHGRPGHKAVKIDRLALVLH